ncbi:MAG: hypothetical protein R3B09_18755 [Nannocystaceae bacterium]
MPVAALEVGVLAYALLSMWRSTASIRLRTLVTLVVIVVLVLFSYNHRTLLRSATPCFRRVIETVESTAIEPRIGRSSSPSAGSRSAT